MHINLDQALVEVNKSKFLRMQNAAGTTLSCVSGSLWVTKDNCIQDFELLPGDTYVANGRQAITVCGFEPSVVRVFQPQRDQHDQRFSWKPTRRGVASFVTHVFAGLRSITRSY